MRLSLMSYVRNYVGAVIAIFSVSPPSCLSVFPAPILKGQDHEDAQGTRKSSLMAVV